MSNKMLVRVAMILVLAIPLGCDQRPAPLEPTMARPRALLVDGANGGGNSFFYFLSPIARPSPAPDGALDAGLLPHLAVSVCALDAGRQCASIVATFTAEGQGPAKLRIENDEEPHFHVNWQTRARQLDPATDYRIAVLVAGTQLGYADVDVVNHPKHLGGVAPGVVGIVSGQTLPIRFLVLEGGVFVIGTSGGTITAFDGDVTLVIPADALSGNTGITIERASGLPAFDGGFVLNESGYDFGPDGLSFASPARLTLAYNETNLPAGREEHELSLLHLVGGSWQGIAGSGVNVDANTVAGPITGFSAYAPGGGTVITLSGSGTAVIDGTMSVAEWINAGCRNFAAKAVGGGTTPATVCVMNDATNLYVAVRYAETTVSGLNWLTLYFDNLDDGRTAGDDGFGTLYDGSGTSASDMFLRSDPSCPGSDSLCYELDELFGGTNDGNGKFANVSGFSVHEIAHPLNSADDSHDFSLSVGAVVGFSLDLMIGGTAMTEFPASVDHAHIVIKSMPGSVTARGNHSCAVTVIGEAHCWGGNGFGELGDGTTTNRSTPVVVSGGLTFASVSAGESHTCGLTTGGAIYCWGWNYYGQLGDGTNTDRLTPVAVSGGLTFIAVSVGNYHSCGLTTAGAVYCWGFNFYGQLADGTHTDRTIPVAVSGGLTFAGLSAGDFHTCALTPSGAAYCWGHNSGQLGNGTSGFSRETSPVAVQGGLTFAAISAGYDHTCGVTTAGDAYCWGSNQYGQLGDGTTNHKTTPVAVAGGLTFTALDAGVRFTCALTVAGAGYCWGANWSGQLGDGTMTDFGTGSIAPVAVNGGHTFDAVSAGAFQTCALTPAGAAYCWGGNFAGQLGDGLGLNSPSPSLVAALSLFAWLDDRILTGHWSMMRRRS